MRHFVTNDDRIKFGQNLTLARERSKLTQEELAGIIDVDRTSIGYWERGERNPKPERIAKLCEALNVDEGYLFGEYKEKTFELSQICKYTGLSETAIDKLKGFSPAFSRLLSAIIEHGDFVPLLETILKRNDDHLLNQMFNSAALFHVANGAELTILDDSGNPIYNGSGKDAYLYESPKDIEIALDLRIQKLLGKIIDDII